MPFCKQPASSRTWCSEILIPWAMYQGIRTSLEPQQKRMIRIPCWRLGRDWIWVPALCALWLSGGRLDHSLANIQALTYLARLGCQGILAGRNENLTVVQNGQLRFLPGAKGYLSVFCLDNAAEGSIWWA